MIIDRIINGEASEILSGLPGGYVDLTVTSPPYDSLRDYQGYSFNFEEVALQLFRVTKDGGILVWVVGDATVKGSETGTSFRQALYLKALGFNLHDTMIYSKPSLPLNHNRYEQDFEYMFVFSKGKPKTFNPLKEKTRFPETNRQGAYGKTTERNRRARSEATRKPVGTEKIKGNIWRYAVGNKHSTIDTEAFEHPAIFPEKLAADHIVTWSNEGDMVLDPFNGSGTTTKMAYILGRKYIGIDISEKYCGIAERRLSQGVLL